MSGRPPTKTPGATSEAPEKEDEADRKSVESPDEDLQPEEALESSAEVSKADDEEPSEVDLKNEDEVKEEPMEENDDGQNDSKPEESLLCDESVEDVDNDDDQASTSDTDRKDSDDGTVSTKRKPLEREISCEVEISQDDKSEDGRMATRRSQRRRAGKSLAVSYESKVFDDFAKSETSEPDPELKPKNEDSNPEDDDAESVTSELDSMTSESTLTTR